MSDDAGWIKAAARSQLGDGEVLGLVIAGREIAPSMRSIPSWNVPGCAIAVVRGDDRDALRLTRSP